MHENCSQWSPKFRMTSFLMLTSTYESIWLIAQVVCFPLRRGAHNKAFITSWEKHIVHKIQKKNMTTLRNATLLKKQTSQPIFFTGWIDLFTTAFSCQHDHCRSPHWLARRRSFCLRQSEVTPSTHRDMRRAVIISHFVWNSELADYTRKRGWACFCHSLLKWVSVGTRGSLKGRTKMSVDQYQRPPQQVLLQSIERAAWFR